MFSNDPVVWPLREQTRSFVGMELDWNLEDFLTLAHAYTACRNGVYQSSLTAAHLHESLDISSHHVSTTPGLFFFFLPPTSTMATPGSPQIEGRDRDLPTLDALIQILVAFEAACIFPPAQIAICSTTALLNIIRVPSLPLFRRRASSSPFFNRTPRPTNKISSILGGTAVTFVGSSTKR